MDETDVDEAQKVSRVVVGDSWFASVRAARALPLLFDVRFIGNVKTAHAGFPIEALRFTLATMDRGEHVVMWEMEDEDGRDVWTGLWALGWHDHHYKTFITNTGTDSDGEPAKKKRNKTNGSTYFKSVQRPTVLENYYSACGKIDAHNRFRQYLLKLEKIWEVKLWQKRIITSVIATTVVDTFLTYGHLRQQQVVDIVAFASDLARQLDPRLDAQLQRERDDRAVQCQLIPIGKKTVEDDDSPSKGKTYNEMQRCTMCQIAGECQQTKKL